MPQPAGLIAQPRQQAAQGSPASPNALLAALAQALGRPLRLPGVNPQPNSGVAQGVANAGSSIGTSLSRAGDRAQQEKMANLQHQLRMAELKENNDRADQRARIQRATELGLLQNQLIGDNINALLAGLASGETDPAMTESILKLANVFQRRMFSKNMGIDVEGGEAGVDAARVAQAHMATALAALIGQTAEYSARKGRTRAQIALDVRRVMHRAKRTISLAQETAELFTEQGVPKALAKEVMARHLVALASKDPTANTAEGVAAILDDVFSSENQALATLAQSAEEHRDAGIHDSFHIPTFVVQDLLEKTNAELSQLREKLELGAVNEEAFNADPELRDLALRLRSATAARLKHQPEVIGTVTAGGLAIAGLKALMNGSEASGLRQALSDLQKLDPQNPFGDPIRKAITQRVFDYNKYMIPIQAMPESMEITQEILDLSDEIMNTPDENGVYPSPKAAYLQAMTQLGNDPETALGHLKAFFRNEPLAWDELFGPYASDLSAIQDPKEREAARKSAIENLRNKILQPGASTSAPEKTVGPISAPNPNRENTPTPVRGPATPKPPEAPGSLGSPTPAPEFLDFESVFRDEDQVAPGATSP